MPRSTNASYRNSICQWRVSGASVVCKQATIAPKIASLKRLRVRHCRAIAAPLPFESRVLRGVKNVWFGSKKRLTVAIVLRNNDG
jgi:hypothetical protein